jgi:hypothetical protein
MGISDAWILDNAIYCIFDLISVVISPKSYIKKLSELKFQQHFELPKLKQLLPT